MDKMGNTNLYSTLVSILTLLVAASLLSTSVTPADAQLVADFYKAKCKNAESVITAAVTSALNKNKTSAAGVLRMHFHDCFVRGCDGSVLIDSPSEKDAIPNLTLHGFEVIDAAKTAVDKECGTGLVSCADILALAAQISVKQMSGGRITWKVPTGRRDGLVSSSSEPGTFLPRPTADVATLKSQFSAVGLTTDQMVTLSGAHSIGVAHCGAFANRLGSPPDSTLDANYTAILKTKCPSGSSNVVNLDLTTPTRLDEVYYKNLQVNKGLLTSDENLQYDAETKPMVAANTNFKTFGPKFASAMLAMGNINVLTGTAGQIRNNCHKFN